MIWVVCSVFDTAVQNYSPPFCVRHLGEATRSFTHEVQGKDSRIAKNPADFFLFHLGSFDDESGTMLPLAAPQRVLGALEVVQAGS